MPPRIKIQRLHNKQIHNNFLKEFLCKKHPVKDFTVKFPKRNKSNEFPLFHLFLTLLTSPSYEFTGYTLT